MDSWFGISSEEYFVPFSTSHIIVLTVAVLGIILLLLFRERLRKESRSFQIMRWIFFSVLVLCETSYQYWAFSNGIWSFSRHVPLHLCGIASLIAMIGLLTLRKIWVQISFFIGIVPSFLALVTPDMPYDYHHYRFWVFFILHMTIPWASLFAALSKPDIISLRSVFKVFGLLVAYAVVIGFAVNPLTGSNYLYLSGLPTADTLLRFFGDGVWYYLNLGITALVIFLLQFFLWKQFIIKKQKRLP
ncbi:YwaF family protein [Planococcus salinarum]|uniref:YwaF family protein n=1 Tax=Planococcus salinarum TaxID=622695 RepID=UPI000E3D0AF1|nr:TIGR02206 family membrane protein [Planococcus salinarum]TAA72053.1 TIGR02206 family membrane protein [Planococcus salinarum]